MTPSRRSAPHPLLSPFLDPVARAARSWPAVTLAPRAASTLELQVDGKEVGRLVQPETVDVPFPAPIVRQLLQEPNGASLEAPPLRGRVRILVQSRDDVQDGLHLLHLSYLYRMTMRESEAAALERIRAELRAVRLAPSVRSLFEEIVAKREQSLFGERALPQAGLPEQAAPGPTGSAEAAV